MAEVLEEVRRLKLVVEERNQRRVRLVAERDVAKTHLDESLATLKGFGVSSVTEAEALLAEKEAKIATEVASLAEALG